MTEGHNGDLSVLVEFIAVQPGLADALIASHVTSSSGDCVGCGGQKSVKWPCVHYKCARAAQAMVAGWRGGPPRLVELIKPVATGFRAVEGLTGHDDSGDRRDRRERSGNYS